MLERIENVVDNENYGAHNLDTVNDHPEHLDHAFSEFQYLEAKTYGAHHLDSVIGHPEYLDHVLNAVRVLEAKTYSALHIYTS